ncbi:MAG: hypothetical protein LBM03_00885 [Erysipelotrichaceae bacterium]|jgi:M6 family metalloprotease-like protein|nr:hypothetical protein [Erysipelotrichaceae bacterium]
MKLKKCAFIGILASLVVAVVGCDDNSTDNYFQVDPTQYKTTFNQLRTSFLYTTEANQAGDVRILVVPVELKGYAADSLPAGRVGTREMIDSVVFGDSPSENPDTEVQWESLRSFYEKSSYGACKMSGYVADWWSVDQTPSEFASRASVQGLVSEVNDYYISGQDASVDTKNFDANNDGCIDLTLFVYSCPQQVLGSDDKVFWAYTTQTSAKKNMETPIISRYIWMSQKFMFENGYWENGVRKDWTNTQIANREAKLDAHTFIHETGHGLGLADYYSYDDGDISPMGQLDMQDYNVGDHSAYSKALMGWTKPYVVDGRATITINSFQKTGDSIIVPIRSLDWKNESYTLLDEYLMIEFDTPTDLVHFDSLHKYAGNYPQWFTQSGVRVTHVDSRIGVFTKSGGTFVGYGKKTEIANENNYVDFAHDNTLSRTVNNNRLVQVLSARGKLMTGTANNADLFRAGDEFGFEKFADFKMNTNLHQTPLGYKFKITAMSETSCTIDFYVV